jgi:uncharacterized protein (DUF2062 family)
LNDTDEIKALSLALGVFIGIIPIWGFQTVLSLASAALLRWNKALSFLGSNISIPPMIPLIIFTSLKIGEYCLPSEKPWNYNLREIDIAVIKVHLLQYLVGSFVLAILASICIGGTVYLMLKFNSRKTQKNVE